MAKKKKKSRTALLAQEKRYVKNLQIHTDFWEKKIRRLIIRKPFMRDEPALLVRTRIDKKVAKPAPVKVTETPKKLYSGFQRVERVESCELKRERRRRAFFGYLNTPRAGKGAAAKKRKSPRSDRFTVKC